MFQSRSIKRQLKRLIINVFYFTRINWVLARFVNRPIILGFHRIKTYPDSLLDQRVKVVHPDEFQEILLYLKSLGYRFVSLEDLVKKLRSSRLDRLAVVTFDDGFKDLYQNAYPILKAFGIPFTLFSTTSTLDSETLLWLHKLYFALEKVPQKKRGNLLRRFAGADKKRSNFGNLLNHLLSSSDKNTLGNLTSYITTESKLSKNEEMALAADLYLTSDELLEMKNHGLTVEAHGHQHWPLNCLDREETKNEVETSVLFIEQTLGRKPGFFALAFGQNNLFIENIIKTLGLNGMCTSETNLVGDSEDSFALPRIGADGHEKIIPFSSFLTRLYLRTLKYRMLEKNSRKCIF